MKRFMLSTLLFIFALNPSHAIEKVRSIDMIDSTIRSNFVRQSESIIKDLVSSAENRNDQATRYVFNILRSSLYEANVKAVSNLSFNVLGTKESLYLHVQDGTVFLNRDEWVNGEFSHDMRPLLIHALLRLNGISDQDLVEELYFSILDEDKDREEKAPYCGYLGVNIWLDRNVISERIFSRESKESAELKAMEYCQKNGLIDCRLSKSGSHGMFKWKKYYSVYSGYAYQSKNLDLGNSISDICEARKSCRSMYEKMGLEFNYRASGSSYCHPF